MHDTSGCQVHLNAQILEQKKKPLDLAARVSYWYMWTGYQDENFKQVCTF